MEKCNIIQYDNLSIITLCHIELQALMIASKEMQCNKTKNLFCLMGGKLIQVQNSSAEIDTFAWYKIILWILSRLPIANQSALGFDHHPVSPSPCFHDSLSVPFCFLCLSLDHPPDYICQDYPLYGFWSTDSVLTGKRQTNLSLNWIILILQSAIYMHRVNWNYHDDYFDMFARRGE